MYYGIVPPYFSEFCSLNRNAEWSTAGIGKIILSNVEPGITVLQLVEWYCAVAVGSILVLKNPSVRYKYNFSSFFEAQYLLGSIGFVR